MGRSAFHSHYSLSPFSQMLPRNGIIFIVIFILRSHKIKGSTPGIHIPTTLSILLTLVQYIFCTPTQCFVNCSCYCLPWLQMVGKPWFTRGGSDKHLWYFPVYFRWIYTYGNTEGIIPRNLPTYTIPGMSRYQKLEHLRLTMCAYMSVLTEPALCRGHVVGWSIEVSRCGVE